MHTQPSVQALRDLLDAFDEGEKDGVVTMDEFLRYYQRVGASIDDDDYFELVRADAHSNCGALAEDRGRGRQAKAGRHQRTLMVGIN